MSPKWTKHAAGSILVHSATFDKWKQQLYSCGNYIY